GAGSGTLNGALAGGPQSIAIGSADAATGAAAANASGARAIAVGTMSAATGFGAVTVGTNATATGFNSAALGRFAEAGDASTALGPLAKSDRFAHTATGRRTT